MITKIKSLILLVALAFTCLAPITRADNIAVVIPANTVSNLLSVPTIVDSMTFTATTASTATIYLYDSSNTTTTRVQAAYISYGQYITNYSVVFTNESSVVITNSFTGLYTYPITNSAATNALPVLMTVVVPGSGQRTKTTQLQTVRGLTAVPNQAVIIEVDYRKNP